MIEFLRVFTKYFFQIIPGLIAGFFLSGLLHEFIPDIWIQENVGKKGLRPILYATFSGAILPLCAWAELPLAISFYKKGARLGPFLAFLLAAPATSFAALIITYQILGGKFALFIFFSVILMGLVVGSTGNILEDTLAKPKLASLENSQNADDIDEKRSRFSRLLFSLTKARTHKKTFSQHLFSIMKFSFVDMMKEVGLGIFLGIVLSALVNTCLPLRIWIKYSLSGLSGYIFSLIVGLTMYTTSIAAVPLADAFMKQGLSQGAGMVFLLAAPLTSYGTMLVLKKEFGTKILLLYLGLIASLSLILGFIFSFF